MGEQPRFPHFNELKRVHIVGVCGTLMGAFAAFLKRRGLEVTGSDENIYPPMSDVLQKAGVVLCSGYRPENIKPSIGPPQMIVIGNVIRRDNPEAQAALHSGIPCVSLPEFMEQLMLQETLNLVVCGTHGKTTTSSILAHVLTVAGKDPSYFIGGVSQNLPHSFHVSSLEKGQYFVLEGDEYDTVFWDKVPKFNHYLPDQVILTSVEYDHADIYPDFESVVRAFDGLIERIRPGGHLIACLDYPGIKQIISKASVSIETYGSSLSSGADWVPAHIQTDQRRVSFDLYRKGEKQDSLEIQLFGMHNVLNAMAVYIQCRKLGIETTVVREALAKFTGVKRRQEIRGDAQGVRVIDDFAHHPTAVRETLRGLKAQYPDRRLVAVFEPRSATSRRRVFQKEYQKAFLEADAIFIASPYDQTRIDPGDRFSSEELVADLKHNGRPARVFQTPDEGVEIVASSSQPNDIIAVLSNGGFGGFISKLLKRLGTT